MVFGEIIEPSSRALWEDDFVEFPEDESSEELVWDEDLKLPETVNKILIGETPQIISLLQKCVLEPVKPFYKSNKTGLGVYKIEGNSYVIIYKTLPDVIVGKLTEKLIPWLKAAQEIFILTSSPITALQNCNRTEMSPCILRLLSSKKVETKYEGLEVPNLVTGFSASVLSYSIHQGLTCSLYVGFLDELCLDSLNTKPLVELLRELKINPVRNYVLQKKALSNNLYM